MYIIIRLFEVSLVHSSSDFISIFTMVTVMTDRVLILIERNYAHTAIPS